MRLNDRHFFLLFMVVSILSVSASARFNASAQQKQPSRAKCPTTNVSCPDSVYTGQKLTFTANLSGGDAQVTPTYNWTVSAGTIDSGQGTSTIEVNTGEAAANSTVTATVDVGGFPRECSSTSASCTTSVIKKAESRKMDEYGSLKPQDENARLDNFGIEIMNDPTAQGFILAYGGRRSRAGDAQKSAARAKDYLVKKRGLGADRVVAVNGGFREQPTIELWIMPSGAEQPQPTPTVDPSEVKPAKPSKPKPKKGRKP